MTTPAPEETQQGVVLPVRVLRELAAVVLIVVGVAAVLVPLFATDWRLGLGGLGVAAVSGGLALASDRNQAEG